MGTPMNGLAVNIRVVFSAKELAGLPPSVVDALSQLSSAAVTIQALLARQSTEAMRDETGKHIHTLQALGDLLDWAKEHGYEEAAERIVEGPLGLAAEKGEPNGT